jgi:transcription initiation factor TFIID subunit 13
VTQFLIAHGDSRQPLPETIRILDEILTEFIQGVSFEATRVAQLAGRQKVKYEDFQFAMRKNPVFLGKAAENKELREIIDKQRKVFNEDEMIKEDLGEGAGGPAGATSGSTGHTKGRKRAAPGGGGGGGGSQANATGETASRANGVDDEELGEMDDVDDAELVGAASRKA